MVTKTKKASESGAAKAKSSAQLAGTVKESAQQIWLAGLGAFSKAQEEGGKVFQALVQEGMSLQRRTQSAAEEKLAEATGHMATDLSSKATGQWDKLEGIFEERVSRALKKLGVPNTSEMETLAERVDQLSRKVDSLTRRTSAKAVHPTAKAAKTPRKRPAATRKAA